MKRGMTIEELEARGLWRQCTDKAGLERALARGPCAVYCGFDATADSLHAGHLCGLLALRAFAADGHRILPVLGTATALVGDPSGRNSMRPKLNRTALARNVEGVRRSMAAVLGPDVALIENSWLDGFGFVEFLREVGSLIPVTHLLSLESTQARLAGGGTMSTLEFAYPLLQAYDFLHLARECAKDGLPLVQIGGSDQWGNICTGLELISKAEPGMEAFGLTFPLLTKSNGEKMGKTASGAVWLNADRMDDHSFLQFWRGCADADLDRLARLFDVPSDGADLSTAEGINALKERMAHKAVGISRGTAAADAALATAKAAFGGGAGEGLRRVEISKVGLSDLRAILVEAGLCATKGEARRLIAQGGIRLDDIQVHAESLSADALDAGPRRLTAGRKRHVLLIERT